MNGEKIAQGREAAKTYLENNPLLCDELEVKIKEKIFNSNEEVVE